MKLTRIHEDGRVIWKREPKDAPSDVVKEKIQTLPSRIVRKLATEDKLIWLYHKFNCIKKSVGRLNGRNSSDPIPIEVSRENVLESTLLKFKETKFLDLRRRLRISFENEEGKDGGGLIRDWLSMLMEQLFSTKLGLFVRANTPEVSYTINVHSGKACPNHLDYFYFCGQLMGKAFYERIQIKAFISKFLIKKLTNEQLTWDDLKYFDVELWKSIDYIKSNRLDGEIGPFVIMQTNSMTHGSKEIELKKNGANIEISEDNKEEIGRAHV